MIQPSGSVETHWNRFDDMSELYSQTENAYLPMEYIGNTEYNAMIMKNSGLGEQSRFVVNDADYEHEELPALYGFEDQVPVSIFKGECIIDFHEIEEAVRFLYEES